MNLYQIETLIEELVSDDRGAPSPQASGELGAWGLTWAPGN